MTTTDEPDDIEASKAPLIDHIIELRNRLMWASIALVIAFIGCYIVAEEIYGFLTRPLAIALGDQEGRRMIYTALHEAFFTYIKVSFWAACFIAFPVVAGQLYMFAAPTIWPF